MHTYLYYFPLSLSLSPAAIYSASEMTYIVSGGALNATHSPPLPYTHHCRRLSPHYRTQSWADLDKTLDVNQ